LLIYHDIIQVVCGKKLSGLRIFCHARCLQTQTSLKKFPRVMKEAARFVGKVMFNLKFEFNFFSTPHIQYVISYVKFWLNFVCI
jgi:hypothetical protein